MMPEFMDNEHHEDFADLYEAFHSLPPLQQQVLRLKYEEYYDYGEISDFYGITGLQAVQRVDRAVYAMTGRINRTEVDESYEASRGQWDTRSKGRKAVSNAAARLMTDGAWGS